MPTKDSRTAQPSTGPVEEAPRVSPGLLWFAVLGGVVAWAVHVLVAWSAMEIACIGPSSTSSLVDQRSGTPGFWAWAVTIGGTALPWLVAVAATVTCLPLRRRVGRLKAGPGTDTLSAERTSFMLVLGIFLDLFSVAAITGGIVALLVLEPCG